MALIHVSVGANERALDVLEQALREKRFGRVPNNFAKDPKFAAIHSNPRLIRIVRALGLKP
jgi:hypothetical protein